MDYYGLVREALYSHLKSKQLLMNFQNDKLFEYVQNKKQPKKKQQFYLTMTVYMGSWAGAKPANAFS